MRSIKLFGLISILSLMTGACIPAGGPADTQVEPAPAATLPTFIAGPDVDSSLVQGLKEALGQIPLPADDWEVYSSSNLGLSFLHPRSWSVKEVQYAGQGPYTIFIGDSIVIRKEQVRAAGEIVKSRFRSSSIYLLSDTETFAASAAEVFYVEGNHNPLLFVVLTHENSSVTIEDYAISEDSLAQGLGVIQSMQIQ